MGARNAYSGDSAVSRVYKVGRHHLEAEGGHLGRTDLVHLAKKFQNHRLSLRFLTYQQWQTGENRWRASRMGSASMGEPAVGRGHLWGTAAPLGLGIAVCVPQVH